MAGMRTNAAAAMLGVSPNTLRSWEQRFGHPSPRRTDGGHRLFELSDIEALRQALTETGDVGSAISLVQQRGEGPSTPTRLRISFSGFDEQGSDRLLEESLAVRSVERTVQDVLLPAVELLSDGSPERCFAVRYATCWLAANKRVAPPASLQDGVMIFDGSAPESIDALHVQALELLLRRAGLRTLCLPASQREDRVGNALRALQPTVLVLGGQGAPLQLLSRLVHATRLSCGPEIEVCDYRKAIQTSGPSTVTRLGDEPLQAVEALKGKLFSHRAIRASAIAH